MKQLLFLFPLLGTALFSACTVIPEKPEIREIPADASADIRIGERMLAAIRMDDFKAFRACLTGGPAANLTDRDFRTSRESTLSQFGTLEDFRYLTELKTPSVRNLLWIATFERTGGNGQKITQELLFRLVLGTLDGRPVVLSFGFF